MYSNTFPIQWSWHWCSKPVKDAVVAIVKLWLEIDPTVLLKMSHILAGSDGDTDFSTQTLHIA
jgi:hypothetical protein